MNIRKKTVFRFLLASVALVLVLGLVAPRLNANRFRERIHTSLRAALGREVEVGGEVRLDIFNGPGFSVDRVVIHEDPSVGLEPFAYVETIEATVSFASFWTGRLEFSNLRLLTASINLARPEGGRWNFESLVSRTAGGVTGGRAAVLPRIEVRGSRINFRLGETKSTFYLADARLDATAPSSAGGDWQVRFEGEPARTDRGSQGFGRFSARGRWRTGGDAGGRIDATFELENGSLSDLIRLAHGHDIGVHGRVGARARLAGPPSNIEITGRMQIGDFHRWDLLPPHTGGWPLDYRGTLDLRAETLRLATVAAAPVALEFRATGFLSQPRWAALLKFEQLPLAPLTEIARHMGLAVPEALAASGELGGVIGYAPGTGIQGMLGASEAFVTIPGSPPLRLENAHVRLDPDAVHLVPTAFTAGPQAATVEGRFGWQSQSWSARITADGMAIAADEPAGSRLLGGIPVLEQCSNGTWSGQLDYLKDGDQAGRWAGVFRVAKATVPLAGLADPLEIVSAHVSVDPDGVLVDHLNARAGAVQMQGEYRFLPAAAHPHQLELRIPSLQAAELERLLLPSLSRNENLLSRALGLGRAPAPEWLEGRHVEAAVAIGSLELDDLPLEKVRARVRWDGANIEATNLAARLGGGIVAGRLSANLRRSTPAYRLALRFRGLGWMGGSWNGRTVLETAGTGPELIGNLRLNGSFRAHSVSLAAETEARDLSGTYAFAMEDHLPTFRFSDILMRLGDASFKGQGATGADGRVHLDLSDGQTQMRLSATVSPFQVEMTAQRSPGTL